MRKLAVQIYESVSEPMNFYGTIKLHFSFCENAVGKRSSLTTEWGFPPGYSKITPTLDRVLFLPVKAHVFQPAGAQAHSVLKIIKIITQESSECPVMSNRLYEKLHRSEVITPNI